MRLLLVLSLAQALRAPLDRRRTLTTRSYGQQQDANDKLPEMKTPEEGKQVRMFGAKLDAGFAGTRASNPKVIRAVLKAYEDKKDTEGSYASNDEQAEIFYASAVEKMNKGFYDDAVKRLNRASYFAGVASRRGGQMQLWLGQALYAAGRRGDALKLLLALKAHPDRDVAKVSKELVFILKAPELQLDESSRVGFDMDNFDAEAKFERAPDGTIKIMKRPEFEKPPEYGSVRSPRFEVLRCLHFLGWTRGHRTRSGVVSFSILMFRAGRVGAPAAARRAPCGERRGSRRRRRGPGLVRRGARAVSLAVPARRRGSGTAHRLSAPQRVAPTPSSGARGEFATPMAQGGAVSTNI